MNHKRTGTILTHISTLSVLLTILAGGLVHATGSGLACPDWPLCFGQYFPSMKGAVFYEHGHRLIAGTTGILVWVTAIYNLFLSRTYWQKLFYVGSMNLIVIQAVFGGLTVIWQLPSWVSTTHFILAHGTLTLMVILSWSVWRQGGGISSRAARFVSTPKRWFSLGVLLLIMIQMVVGAWLRHIGSPGAPINVACEQFPLCEPTWVNVMTDYFFTYYILHRILAVVVTVGIVWLTWQLRSLRGRNPLCYHLALFSSVTVLVQVLLGELTVRMFLAVSPATLHLAGANLILIALLWLQLELWDPRRLIETL